MNEYEELKARVDRLEKEVRLLKRDRLKQHTHFTFNSAVEKERTRITIPRGIRTLLKINLGNHVTVGIEGSEKYKDHAIVGTYFRVSIPNLTEHYNLEPGEVY